jgi:putative ABC transport system ATP-binding protein
MSVAVEQLKVVYPTASGPVTALAPISFRAGSGELVMVTGPSGTGKTTLLSCLAGILRPTSGRVAVDGVDLRSLEGRALADHRRTGVGMIFQQFNLIASLTAAENVAVPMWASGVRRRRARTRALELLERLDLTDRADHRPGLLSGGQQQRVAIARAIALDPPLLIADEPTANLDVASAESVVELLRSELASGRTIVMATHDLRLRGAADQVIDLVPTSRPPRPGGDVIDLGPGEVLFEVGDASDFVYRVERGDVVLLREGADGSPVVVRRCGAGEHFGEMGPLLGFPRSATARTDGGCTVTALSLADFRREAAGHAVPVEREPEPC